MMRMQAAVGRAVTAVAVLREAAGRVMIRIRAAQAVAAVCVRHVRHAVPILTRATEARACAATPVEVIRGVAVPAASGAVVRRMEAIRVAAVVRAVIAAVAAHARVEATAAAVALAEAAVVRVAAAMAVAAVEAAATVRDRAVAVDKTTLCREKEKTA